MNRILIIDDEPGISELISDALTKFGFTVKTASSGREGLRLLHQATFDLVVTDMSMPDVDGACIVRNIRRSERPLTPVIGISGTPWLLEGAACDAALHKPFLLQALVDTIRRLIGAGLSAPRGSTAVPFPEHAPQVL